MDAIETIVAVALTFLYVAGFCAGVAALMWAGNTLYDWLTRKRSGEPAHATGELRTVTRAWVRCTTCRRLLKKGERAIFHRPNRVYRCADCAKAEPEMAKIQKPQPGECPSCHSLARELPFVIRMNGREMHVCRTCAEFVQQRGIRAGRFMTFNCVASA